MIEKAETAGDKIRRDILKRINSGELKPGAPILSTRKLADYYHVSPVTVHKALKRLAFDKYLVRRDRHGTYVSEEPPTKTKPVSNLKVGLSLFNVMSEYWGKIASALEKTLRASNCELTIHCNTDFENFFTSTDADGYIVTPPNELNSEMIEPYLNKTIVFIGERLEYNYGKNCVYSDDGQSSYGLVKYLISLGHRRIAHVAGPKETPTARDRLVGYKRALKESGIEINDEHIGGWSYHNEVHEFVEATLRSKNPPTAFVCSNDSTATSVYEVASKMGLSIPEDLSVTGFGNDVGGILMDPPLTTVDQNPDLIGSLTGEMLINLLTTPTNAKARNIKIPTEIIFRGSCALCLETFRKNEQELKKEN